MPVASDAPKISSPAELAEQAASREVRAAAAPSTPTPKQVGHHYNPIRSKKP